MSHRMIGQRRALPAVRSLQQSDAYSVYQEQEIPAKENGQRRNDESPGTHEFRSYRTVWRD